MINCEVFKKAAAEVRQPFSAELLDHYFESHFIVMSPPLPCVYCDNELLPRQEILQCDRCPGRQHRKCSTGKCNPVVYIYL